MVVLHGALAPDAPPDERDVLVQAAAVESALAAAGLATRRLAVGLDLAAARRALADAAPAVVFNLVEAIGGRGRLVHLAPALLDALGIPYTGSPTEALFLSSNKRLAKQVLSGAGVPTPPWWDGERVEGGPWPGPWIVKSVWEHASFGLTDEAVVPTLELALARAAALGDATGGEWLAEAYVDGRELNVALLAGPEGVPEPLPVSEIRFDGLPAGRPRIVGYAAKWVPESPEYRHTVRRWLEPADDGELAGRLVAFAERCWALLGLAGYARVDFRVDGDGRPWVLEVNANPCLSPDAGFAAAVGRAGVGYEVAVVRLVEDALRRGARGAGRGGPARGAFRPHARGGASEALREPQAGLRHGPGGPPGASGPGTADRPGDALPVAYRGDLRPDDAASIEALVRATGFFTAGERAIAVELVTEALVRGPASGYSFLFAEAGGRLAGYTCYGPVPGTRSSFDLYWIAVDPALQGRGLGRALLARTEAAVVEAGGERLYIETSARPQYAPTHGFYARSGYRREAFLADFYAPGDGKLIYVKALFPSVASLRGSGDAREP